MPSFQYNNRLSLDTISIIEQLAERDKRSPGFIIEWAVEQLAVKEKIKPIPGYVPKRKLPGMPAPTPKKK